MSMVIGTGPADSGAVAIATRIPSPPTGVPGPGNDSGVALDITGVV